MTTPPPPPPPDEGTPEPTGAPEATPAPPAGEPAAASEVVASPAGAAADASAGAPAATGMSTGTKVLAVVVVLVLVLAGAAAIWWFAMRRANAVYLAAAATAEAQNVAMTAHLEIDEGTLDSMASGEDVEITVEDVSDIGLRVQRSASDQQSGVAWLPAGSWSYSLLYRGNAAGTLGVTEATGSPVLAAKIDPTALDTLIARAAGSSDVTFEELTREARASAAGPWKPYLEDLLDGKSVGVDVGPGSFIVSTIQQGLSETSQPDTTAQQQVLQDMWARLKDQAPSAVTTTEVGSDQYGAQYTVVADVPQLAAMTADALRQSCGESSLDADAKTSCQESADDLADWKGEGWPQQLQFDVWLKDGRVSRVSFDIAQAIRAVGDSQDLLTSDAVLKVVIDLSYDQPPFDFTDLVVIPDEVLKENVGDTSGMLPSDASPLPTRSAYAEGSQTGSLAARR